MISQSYFIIACLLICTFTRNSSQTAIHKAGHNQAVTQLGFVQTHYLSAVIQFSNNTNGESKNSNNGEKSGHNG